jgi:hypothetical protein
LIVLRINTGERGEVGDGAFSDSILEKFHVEVNDKPERCASKAQPITLLPSS